MTASNDATDRPLRVAIIADFLEEQWPSMDLVAAMLARELRLTHRTTRIEAEILRPPFLRPLTRFSRLRESRRAYNAERALNRYGWYPLWLRHVRGEYDLFHVIDHSYAHLVNSLPADRTFVTCHDLDSFRPLLEPSREPRSAAFRLVIGCVLKGLRRATVAFCATEATRQALIQAAIRDCENTLVVHNGVDAETLAVETYDAEADRFAAQLMGPAHPASVEILHVGHVEPRKRIDLLLRVFAGIRREFPQARLIRVGGAMNDEQTKLAHELGIAGAIVALPFIERTVLGAVYRRAALLLMPSESEGFGLPVIEALACGTQVLASDIPALREVGGEAAVFCPVGAIEQWTSSAIGLIREKISGGAIFEARRAAGVVRGSRFSWRDTAAQIAAIYQTVVEAAPRRVHFRESGSESLCAMKDVE
jgi:glycosyltransferase involved in cell wall biosynthesis